MVDLSAAQGDRDIGLRPNVSHMGVSNNRGTHTPKMDGENNGKPY